MGMKIPLSFLIHGYIHTVMQLNCGDKKRPDGNYIQIGSWLIFCSGDAAAQGKLLIDAMFHVGNIGIWQRMEKDTKCKLKLPKRYQKHYKNEESPLWNRHLKYPFLGNHKSVTHTYEAQMWRNTQQVGFSYLPYDAKSQRVSMSIDTLPMLITNKICENIRGRRPVLLSDEEIEIIVQIITKQSVLKVLIITGEDSLDSKSGNKKCYSC